MSEVHEQVRRTLAAYCQAVDDGRFDDVAACFAAGAVVDVMGEQVRGRSAIRDWLEAAMPPERRGVHVVANVVIDVTSAGAADVSSDFLFFASGTLGMKVTASGRYLDRFVVEDDRWVIAARTITLRPGRAA
jgi:3-phenylpropionate/cinnamic acid dioxygenase small subunit